MGKKKVEVVNVNGSSEDNSRNWIEHYYNNMYLVPLPSSIKCPFCGKTMYRKKNNNIDERDIMIGAHVKIVDKPDIYILPICKECNSKNDNLKHEVEENKLLKLS